MWQLVFRFVTYLGTFQYHRDLSRFPLRPWQVTPLVFCAITVVLADGENINYSLQNRGYRWTFTTAFTAGFLLTPSLQVSVKLVKFISSLFCLSMWESAALQASVCEQRDAEWNTKNVLIFCQFVHSRELLSLPFLQTVKLASWVAL